MRISGLVMDANRDKFTGAAHALVRAVKTLEYVGVGYVWTTDEDPAPPGTCECDCLWFRVTARPRGENPLLEPVPPADCEALRERLLDTPRAS